MNPRSPLREAVCHSDNLSLAYARHAKQRGLWAPGLSMSAVAAAPARAILKLAEELREGRYKPYPPRTVPIVKADGGQREIAVYMLRDRVAQRALLQVLQERTDASMSPFSFGYRPGRGVNMALNCVRSHLEGGYGWVGDADIERCFDSIPHRPLLAQVERRVQDDTAPALIAKHLDWNRGARRHGVGIPQGSGLAPWLCNIYLWLLDDRMREADVPMVRYADDFVLLARTRQDVEDALSLCRETLEFMRLKLHPVKTRVLDALASFRFLGRSLSVSPPASVAEAV
jgi:RNA-directed DNA polymerase